eukprot:TRINITY_DN18527_c1_g1_i1.p1 TRINITY_DN18527_c1_g1~~TRINITY_DN18527_c1_g1_i1.p1  ORF type:complete len:507 (-),score=119.51 TRINITY_DN18527_c1_g1_i1:92-1612(-)
MDAPYAWAAEAQTCAPTRGSIAALSPRDAPTAEPVQYYNWRPKRQLSSEELVQLEIEQKRFEVQQMMEKNRRYLSRHSGSVQKSVILSIPTPTLRARSVSPPARPRADSSPSGKSPRLLPQEKKRPANPSNRLSLNRCKVTSSSSVKEMLPDASTTLLTPREVEATAGIEPSPRRSPRRSPRTSQATDCAAAPAFDAVALAAAAAEAVASVTAAQASGITSPRMPPQLTRCSSMPGSRVAERAASRQRSSSQSKFVEVPKPESSPVKKNPQQSTSVEEVLPMPLPAMERAPRSRRGTAPAGAGMAVADAALPGACFKVVVHPPAETQQSSEAIFKQSAHEQMKAKLQARREKIEADAKVSNVEEIIQAKEVASKEEDEEDEEPCSKENKPFDILGLGDLPEGFASFVLHEKEADAAGIPPHKRRLSVPLQEKNPCLYDNIKALQQSPRERRRSFGSQQDIGVSAPPLVSPRGLAAGADAFNKRTNKGSPNVTGLRRRRLSGKSLEN